MSSRDSALAWAPLRLCAAPGTPLGAIFGAIGAMAAGLVAVVGLDRLPFPVCLVKAVSGLPCPSCGSTRALACLAHADLAGAFLMNPLAALAALAIAAWAVADLALLRGGRALSLEVRQDVVPVLRVAAVVAVLANWSYLVWAGR